MLVIAIGIIFLAGLIFFIRTFLPGIQRRSTGCALSYLGTGSILMITAAVIGLKIYRCDFPYPPVPDEIRIAGHIKQGTTRPNNYLVILFKENDEVTRGVTRYGKFAADKNDQEGDGYFELTLPNQDQLTRCSMRQYFQQSSAGRNFFWLEKKIPFIWHNFVDLETGTYTPVTGNRARAKYTLVVLPASVDKYPHEISTYHTYLDPSGQVAINEPIKTYTSGGTLPQENPTGYFIRPDPLANAPQAVATPAVTDIWDAWVMNGTSTVLDDGILDEEIIDWNNCDGSKPDKTSKVVSFIYTQEVQFREDAAPNFDLGVVASKAAQSLGFTQGQLRSDATSIDVEAPVGAYRKYRVLWQRKWKTGSISIASGPNTYEVPFRAIDGMEVYPQAFDVQCP